MVIADRISTSPFSNPFPPSALGVVIHATRSGIPGNPSELEGTLNWFKNPAAQVSAHWVIGRQGQKVRVIPDSRQAWHAGEHNATHFGIELESAVESDGFTEPQIASLVEVCRAYITDFGIAPNHEFLGFIGHSETPQGHRVGKTDPGNLFPWDAFIAAIAPHPVPVPPPAPPFDYTREQALWSIHALGWKYGIQLFDPTQSPADLDSYDKAILRDIISKL